MSNIAAFTKLLQANAQTATFHREEAGTPCPCRTPEGFRDPLWHEAHPGSPVCNEKGLLSSTVTNVVVKAFIQPAQASHGTRLSADDVEMLFGEVIHHDHLGIFPLDWNSTTLNFYDWSPAGEDYIVFDGRRFTVVNANKIPDPKGGGFHHWEVGLRLMTNTRP